MTDVIAKVVVIVGGSLERGATQARSAALWSRWRGWSYVLMPCLLWKADWRLERAVIPEDHLVEGLWVDVYFFSFGETWFSGDACLLRTGAQVAPAHAAYWRGHCGAHSIAWLCSLLIRTELDIGFQTDTEARVACGQSTWSCKWLALKGSESFKVRRRWLTVASSTLRIELLLNAETGWNCWRWVSSGCLLNAC